MKKRILIAAALWYVFVLGVVPAFAQAESVKAKIPFNFAVPGKVFRAGEYTMTIRPHELRIGAADGRVLAVMLANDADGRMVGQQGRVVFRCYRDRCFLAEVWAPGHEHGLEFYLSPVEAEFTRQESGVYFALLGETP